MRSTPLGFPLPKVVPPSPPPLECVAVLPPRSESVCVLLPSSFPVGWCYFLSPLIWLDCSKRTKSTNHRGEGRAGPADALEPPVEDAEV